MTNDIIKYRAAREDVAHLASASNAINEMLNNIRATIPKGKERKIHEAARIIDDLQQQATIEAQLCAKKLFGSARKTKINKPY